MKNLIGESLRMAVLDSGCTKSVEGEMWLDKYLQTLFEQDRSQVSERSNDATLRFGDEVEVTLSKSVKFPVVVGSQKFFIEADIVTKYIEQNSKESTTETLTVQLLPAPSFLFFLRQTTLTQSGAPGCVISWSDFSR